MMSSFNPITITTDIQAITPNPPPRPVKQWVDSMKNTDMSKPDSAYSRNECINLVAVMPQKVEPMNMAGNDVA